MQNDLMKRDIEVLDLSVRPLNVLKRGGIRKIEDLCGKTEGEIRALRNMGNHSMTEIIKAMEEHGLYFLGEKAIYGRWIPIGEMKPPIGIPLVVTIKDNLGHNPNELRYPVYYEKDHIRQGYSWNWRYGDFNYQLMPEVSEVVAYMELPKVYESEV